MRTPNPLNYLPEVGDVVIGKFAKLDGKIRPRVVIALEDFDSSNDSIYAVDEDGDVMFAFLNQIKFVPLRYISPSRGKW